MNRPRVLFPKYFDVMDDLPVRAIHADGPQRMTFVHRRGQPDLVSLDGRGRPAQPRERRLPGDVLGLAPRERQAALGRVTLTIRPAKLRPIFSTTNLRTNCD